MRTQNNEQRHTPSPRTLRSDIIFTICLLILLGIAWEVRDVILLVYISALFAVVLSPAIEAVRRLHIGRWWPSRGMAIVLIILIAFIGFGSFLVFAVPPMYRDLMTASKDMPGRITEIVERLHQIPTLEKLDINPNALEDWAGAAAGGALGVFKGLAGGLFALFSWMVITAYFILDGQKVFYYFLSFFAEPERGRLRATLLRAEKRIRHWLVGQGMMMLILGVSAGITFWLMKVRYALFLGVIAGLLNIIPFAGPVTSFVLSSSVAAMDSWAKLFGVVAFYFLYQQIENAFLYPKIMKYSVNLSALAVIIALSLGGAIAGVLGALIAVPTAAVIGVLLDEYFVRFRPHRYSKEAPGMVPPETATEPEMHNLH